MTPVPGDFACIHTRGDVGTLITIGQFLNGTPDYSWWDHACIFVGGADVASPYGYVMGAQPSGARLDPLRQAQFTGKDADWLWSSGKLKLTDDQRRAIVAQAIACKGIGYSWADYLALAAHRFHIPAPHLKNYIASSKSMICSTLVDFCYMNAGVKLFDDGRWQGDVTPADLASLLVV